MLGQKRVKLIGVCFGHQIVGRALGAPVARSEKGFEMSVIELNLSARGKELFDGKDKLVRLPNPLLLDNTAELFFVGQSKGETPEFLLSCLDLPENILLRNGFDLIFF